MSVNESLVELMGEKMELLIGFDIAVSIVVIYSMVKDTINMLSEE